ncbi:MAG: ribonuclease HII [Spirochaetaceae bacterium]|nr:MAG: ribonuclease HII [Spirochaetaceae bacterium]
MCAAMHCGVDEAGRGPLAGPVTAAAVLLPEEPDGRTRKLITTLADSKKLTPRAREDLAVLIREHAVAWGTGWSWPEEIDRVNILQAAMLAMSRACEALGVVPPAVFVDGNRCPVVPGAAVYAVIKGDGYVPSIMAASILAKTARDAWMCEYAIQDDRYGFEVHKGYPTALHKARLAEHGPSAIHRVSFRGVVQEARS